MSSIICNFNFFSDWWKGKHSNIPHTYHPNKYSRIALSIPLVLENVLKYVPYSELRKLRLVNRTWNHEITRHLQKRNQDHVKFTVPYNAATCKFLHLADEVLALEQDTNIQWCWSFSKVQLSISATPRLLPVIEDVEKLLCTISSQLPGLESLFVNQLDLPQVFLDSFAAFLICQESKLRFLRISSDSLSTCEPTRTYSISLKNLVDLEISTNAAAILFGPPNNLPPIKALKLQLDQSNPDYWLSLWNGREMSTVTKFSLFGSPRKLDCVPWQVVHKICKVFPNIKVLHLQLRLSNYPEEIFLDLCVPPLQELEELYLNLCGVWKLSPELQNPNFAAKKLKTLTLEYSDGFLTTQHLENIFLRQVSRQGKLYLKSRTDHGFW